MKWTARFRPLPYNRIKSSSSAKADDPVNTMLSVYWMPAFAGHDGFFYPLPLLLPLAIDKSLHQPLRLAGQERLPEYADAEIDGLLQR